MKKNLLKRVPTPSAQQRAVSEYEQRLKNGEASGDSLFVVGNFDVESFVDGNEAQTQMVEAIALLRVWKLAQAVSAKNVGRPFDIDALIGAAALLHDLGIQPDTKRRSEAVQILQRNLYRSEEGARDTARRLVEVIQRLPEKWRLECGKPIKHPASNSDL